MIRTATLSPTVAAEALQLTGWQRLLLAIRGLMNCHATLDGVDRPLDRLYGSLVASLFTRWSQAIWTVLVVLGSVAFLHGAGRAEQAFAEPGGAALLWLLVPITVAAIAAHIARQSKWKRHDNQEEDFGIAARACLSWHDDIASPFLIVVARRSRACFDGRT